MPGGLFMLILIIAASGLAFIALEAWMIWTGQTTISEYARILSRTQPWVVHLAMLGIGLLLGHFWWC